MTHAVEAEQPSNTDPLDVLRILQTSEPETIANTLRMLTANELAGEVPQAAIDFLRSDRNDPDGVLVRLAVQATTGLEDPDTVAGSMNALVEDLLDSYETVP